MNLRQYAAEVHAASFEFCDRLRLASDDYNARMKTATDAFLGSEPETSPAAPETAAEPSDSAERFEL